MAQNSYDVTLRYRGVGVRVSFVDGNTYNGTPAKCYTRDEFKQRAIENSQLYKDGDIVLERSVEEESDRKKAAEKAAKAAGNPATESQGTVTGNQGTVKDTQGTGEGGDDDGMEKMTFGNLGEAILYIATTYQVQVQTANEARALLKEKGIKATVKQG